MSTPLDQALRDSGSDLALTTPVESVIARGDRLRSRRRRAAGLGAAGLLGLATVGAAAVLPAGSGLAPTAVAAWSGPSTNLTPAQLEAVSDACSDSARSMAPRRDQPFGSVPVAAELRDGLALAYFHDGGSTGTCTLRVSGDGGFRVTGQSTGRWRQLRNGQDVAFQAAGAADAGRIGGPLSEVTAVLRVSPRVDRVDLMVGDETVRGSVADGLAFFWARGETTESELDAAEVVAYGSDGAVLDRSGL